MYKYTVRKDVVKEYIKLARKPTLAARDETWFMSVRIAGTAHAVFACGHFWRNYAGTVFYSKERRVHVPVNGILIKACWFEETVV